jgi:hypothetical protein
MFKPRIIKTLFGRQAGDLHIRILAEYSAGSGVTRKRERRNAVACRDKPPSQVEKPASLQ